MWIDVAWTGQEVDEQRVKGHVAVVIDVLRATTMIATLLDAGARDVWPVTEVEEARQLASSLGKGIEKGTLLAGERGGLPPEGFDFGNSPREVSAEKVRDRSVVVTTTNGTLAINRSVAADAVVTAAFVNVGAVADWMLDRAPERLLVVCAGTVGRFSLDDALCAGALVDRLTDKFSNRAPVELSDSALAARSLYQQSADNLLAAISNCKHGKNLIRLGLGADLAVAANVDALHVVPILEPSSGGRYRLLAAS